MDYKEYKRQIDRLHQERMFIEACCRNEKEDLLENVWNRIEAMDTCFFSFWENEFNLFSFA